MKIRNLVLAASLLLPATLGNAHAREVIPNHLENLLQYGQFESRTISGVTIMYQGNSPRARELVSTVENFLPKVKSMTNFNNLQTCQDLDLKILIMNESLLNNREVVDFLSWYSISDNGIYGAYDSFHDTNTGEIYISALGSTTFFTRTLAHEFWHHVQDVTCGNKTEREAVDFSIRYCSTTSDC